jgi:hypothetical protein
MAKQLSGIYRATVINTVDPLTKSRLYISVLDTPGTTGWALPCVSYDRSNKPPIPPVGETVWAMFEDGDANSPVWLGWTPS